MEILEFIAQEGLVMIPVLLIIGSFIKSAKFIPNEYIPFVLLAISVILTPLVLGGYSANTFVQSVLVTGVAVLGNQMYKQVGYLKGEEKNNGN